jgi:phosphoglycolate phosphatase-like HAD superfamily hydrolase
MQSFSTGEIYFEGNFVGHRDLQEARDEIVELRVKLSSSYIGAPQTGLPAADPGSAEKKRYPGRPSKKEQIAENMKVLLDARQADLDNSLLSQAPEEMKSQWYHCYSQYVNKHYRDAMHENHPDILAGTEDVLLHISTAEKYVMTDAIKNAELLSWAHDIMSKPTEGLRELLARLHKNDRKLVVLESKPGDLVIFLEDAIRSRGEGPYPDEN